MIRGRINRKMNRDEFRCHRSAYSQTCAGAVPQVGVLADLCLGWLRKTQVSDYRDLWHRKCPPGVVDAGRRLLRYLRPVANLRAKLRDRRRMI
jgi:hypothetical protein